MLEEPHTSVAWSALTETEWLWDAAVVCPWAVVTPPVAPPLEVAFVAASRNLVSALGVGGLPVPSHLLNPVGGVAELKKQQASDGTSSPPVGSGRISNTSM
jgi:hypothetical protein